MGTGVRFSAPAGRRRDARTPPRRAPGPQRGPRRSRRGASRTRDLPCAMGTYMCELRSRQERSSEAGHGRDAERSGNTIYNARLTPHRSLNAKGFRVLMAPRSSPARCSACRSMSSGHGRSWAFSGSTSLFYSRPRQFPRRQGLQGFGSAIRTTVQASEPGRPEAGMAVRAGLGAVERVEHQEFGVQRLSLHNRGRRWDIAKFLGPTRRPNRDPFQPRPRRSATRPEIFG